MSEIKRFEVCPHCGETFDPNEYMPKVLGVMDEMIETLKVSSEAIQKYQFEVVWENTEGLERDVKALFVRLSDLWDGTDSRGYEEYCKDKDR